MRPRSSYCALVPSGVGKEGARWPGRGLAGPTLRKDSVMARSPRRGALAFVAALLLMLACASQAGAATYSVNTTDDTDDAALDGTCADGSGKCSLRAAFDEANDNEGADEIVLPAGHYVFRSDGTALQVESGMITLKGAGAADTIVDSDGWDSAFFVNPNSTFDASGISVIGERGCSCSYALSLHDAPPIVRPIAGGTRP